MIVSSTVENIPLNKALEYHDDFKALIPRLIGLLRSQEYLWKNQSTPIWEV